VTKRGVFVATPATFRPEDPVTGGTLARVVSAVTGTPATAPAAPAPPVSMANLDSTLVRGIGLGDAAHRFYLGARRAGLDPPAQFGTETVARLLGLRTNHPAAQDDLELQPQEPATRAEAAFSVAQVLRLGESDLEWTQEASAAFALPALTPWQRRILRTAVSFVGYPYVWGGEDERTERGFDCFRVRLARVQAHAVRRRAWSRRDAPQPNDLPDERRGAEGAPRSVRGAPARRCPLLRPRDAVEAEPDRPCRDLPRQRLVRPFVGPRCRPRAARRLVPDGLCVGPSTAGRRRARVKRRQTGHRGLVGCCGTAATRADRACPRASGPRVARSRPPRSRNPLRRLGGTRSPVGVIRGTPFVVDNPPHAAPRPAEEAHVAVELEADHPSRRPALDRGCRGRGIVRLGCSGQQHHLVADVLGGR
jgi:hypothetical protein